jgi:hypothetical protein
MEEILKETEGKDNTYKKIRPFSTDEALEL